MGGAEVWRVGPQHHGTNSDIGDKYLGRVNGLGTYFGAASAVNLAAAGRCFPSNPKLSMSGCLCSMYCMLIKELESN